MGGRYVRLQPGRYALAVSTGAGPAGVQRLDGTGVHVGIDGGRAGFEVGGEERVYFWWRGPEERPGVTLLGLTEPTANPTRARPWPTGTTG